MRGHPEGGESSVVMGCRELCTSVDRIEEPVPGRKLQVCRFTQKGKRMLERTKLVMEVIRLVRLDSILSLEGKRTRHRRTRKQEGGR